MPNTLEPAELVKGSVEGAITMIVPSLPFLLAFCVGAGCLSWVANTLPEGFPAFLVFASMTFGVLFLHSLFSASMYRAVLPKSGSLLGAAWKLTLAWLLVLTVVAIIAVMILLFFSLIGASLGVVSGDSTEISGGQITDMTAQMRDAGTFWPLFALFVLTLFGVFWFVVRLMLFAAATVSRQAVHVFRSWAWTKGHFKVLGPLMVLLIALPIGALGWLAHQVSSLVIGADVTPLTAALSASLSMLVLAPSAWVGHGFAAEVYRRLAPDAG